MTTDTTTSWINLDGPMPKYGRKGMLVNLDTGEVEHHLGKWQEISYGNISGTDLFKSIKNSYGTSEGKAVRERASLTLILGYNIVTKELELEDC